jgi:hypothetical protein
MGDETAGGLKAGIPSAIDDRSLADRRVAMGIAKGDRVSVNLAPFIGSMLPCKETIACTVVEVRGVHVLVETEPPYRPLSLWVLHDWVEGLHREPAANV